MVRVALEPPRAPAGLLGSPGKAQFAGGKEGLPASYGPAAGLTGAGEARRCDVPRT